jgi:hypothetical protein
VVSRLIDTGSLSVTTGRSSRPQAAACIQAPVLWPKWSISQCGLRGQFANGVDAQALQLFVGLGADAVDLAAGQWPDQRCRSSS